MKLRNVALACICILPWQLFAADKLTWEQQETFLLKAKVGKITESKKGVTGTSTVTMSDGQITHNASVQTIDKSVPIFLGEVNFKDTYRFNIAAWKLARLLGIGDMTPPVVKRNFKGEAASFSWWIDDVMMDELDMKAKGVTAPNPTTWNQEYAIVRVFDQLIYNMDRNQTNILIGSDWRIWMIDHGRGFRIHKTLKDPGNLTMIDRNLLAALKTLNEPQLKKEIGSLVNKGEITGLLARRDLIVQFFEAKGEAGLFTRPVRP